MNIRNEIEKKELHVVIIIDASSSMGPFTKETLNGINEQLDQYRNEKGLSIRASVISFSGYSVLGKLNYTKIVDYVKINEVPTITSNDYIPNGMTAMRDAVGMTLESLINDNKPDENKLIVIITDGAENDSREYSWAKLKEIVTKCENDSKFTISYLGANQNLFALEQNMGLSKGSIATYDANSSLGRSNSFKGLNETSMTYLASIKSNTNTKIDFFQSNNGEYVNLSSDPSVKDNNESKS